MTSSTSSSRSSRRRHAIVCLACFGLGFSTLAVGGEALSRRLDVLAYAHPGPSPAEHPGSDWYVDHGYGVDALSHLLLYYGLGASIENAREADILFLGSSRSLFAFPEEPLEAFAGEHGLRVFNLSFAHAEGSRFPLRVIEKFDLAPRLVVVGADGFFGDALSPRGAEIYEEQAFYELKGYVEAAGRYLYEIHGRRFLPHFLPRVPPPVRQWSGRGSFALLRSSRSGAWFDWSSDEDRAEPVVETGGAASLTEEQVAQAVRFRDALAARGTALVLTAAPTSLPLQSVASLRDLAERLEVPFLRPDVPGLTTRDYSHLNWASGTRFTEALLEELERSEAFRSAFPEGSGE